MRDSIKLAALATIALGFICIVRPVVDDYMTSRTREWVEVKFIEHGFIPKPTHNGRTAPKVKRHYVFPNNRSI